MRGHRHELRVEGVHQVAQLTQAQVGIGRDTGQMCQPVIQKSLRVNSPHQVGSYRHADLGRVRVTRFRRRAVFRVIRSDIPVDDRFDAEAGSSVRLW